MMANTNSRRYVPGWRTRLVQLTLLTLLVLGVIFMFIPVLWVVLSSLKKESEFLA